MALQKIGSNKSGGKKKELHPALRANADKLKNGEPLSPGTKKKRPAAAASRASSKQSPKKKRG